MIVHVLRKPLIGTVAANALQHGCGALNIDECRVAPASSADFERHKARVEALKAHGGSMANSWKNSSDLSGASDVMTAGRWPANLVHDGTDEVVEMFPESNRWFNAPRNSDGKGKDGPIFDTHRGSGMDKFGDSGSAARFFQQVTIK